MGVLYQNPPLDGLVRLDRLGSAPTRLRPCEPPGLRPELEMGSALDLRKDLLYVYFMKYIQDYARGPDLTIIGKKDNHYLL